MSASIPLANDDRRALVDLDMVPVLSQFSWRSHRIGQKTYAYARMGGAKMYLHRFILQPPPGLLGDHKNGDGLDNRRENLRVATKGQNNVNRPVKNATGFRGVSRRPRYFVAYICIDGRGFHLGCFKTPEQAARAFDAAALAHWGEFARLNFPKQEAQL